MRHVIARYGQLGLGHRDDALEPSRVPRLGGRATRRAAAPPLRVVGVACGGGHTAAVDAAGGVWTVGSNSCGQLGLDVSDRYC